MFKTGITRSPLHKAFNDDFGYFRRGELYDRMDLLAVSFPVVAAFLEICLIDLMKDRRGCRNASGGGESPPASGICYVYVVSLEVGDGRPVRIR